MCSEPFIIIVVAVWDAECKHLQKRHSHEQRYGGMDHLRSVRRTIGMSTRMCMIA